MATLTLIDEAEAPRRLSDGASASRRQQAEYDGYLELLKKGQVGKLVPSGGETTRGVSARISRAARRAGKIAETWSVDGVVYFRLE